MVIKLNQKGTVPVLILLAVIGFLGIVYFNNNPLSQITTSPVYAAVTHVPSNPWPRHTIDNTSLGADGVRLKDVNGDGLKDIAVAWEQGNTVRAYLHPGYADAKNPWPKVQVGTASNGEDANFTDFDKNGIYDVTSSLEGASKQINFHWAPDSLSDYLDSSQWQTATLSASLGKRWMFSFQMAVDNTNGDDLVAGGRLTGAQIGWFKAPLDSRTGTWTYHTMSPVGWTMSLLPKDMDGDGDLDVLVSDREGSLNGTRWLKNPGPSSSNLTKSWTNIFISKGSSYKFLTTGDLDNDGQEDVVTTQSSKLIFSRRLSGTGTQWTNYNIPLSGTVGSPKSPAIADVDGDGNKDIVFSSENADGIKSGVEWLSYVGSPTSGNWLKHDISGVEGTKFDLVEMVDMDGDGDLDVVTTEERESLGVIWYENTLNGL